MKKKDDTVYLKHILDAISLIEEYTNGMTYDDFIDNHLVQDGVIRQIQIIGEATKRLSNSLKEKNKQIPWRDITGMRDKLVHDYLGVDLDAVWYTIEKDIPSLKSKIKKILEKS